MGSVEPFRNDGVDLLRIGSPSLDESVQGLTMCSGREVILPPETERYRRMSRTLDRLFMAIGFMAALGVSAHASPRCLKDQTPFALADDFVSWTMSAAPGSECIQGLRWSYMQIYGVLVLKAPTKGKLVIVGSGFRYFADSENHEADSFTLIVAGKNRHDSGTSTLEIAVKHPLGTVVSELPQRP